MPGAQLWCIGKVQRVWFKSESFLTELAKQRTYGKHHAPPVWAPPPLVAVIEQQLLKRRVRKPNALRAEDPNNLLSRSLTSVVVVAQAMARQLDSTGTPYAKKVTSAIEKCSLFPFGWHPGRFATRHTLVYSIHYASNCFHNEFHCRRNTSWRRRSPS